METAAQSLPTPDDIMELKAPTEKFLCKLSDNWPNFQFKGFKIRDMVSNITLVEVAEEKELEHGPDAEDPTKRLIKYHFGPDFLYLKTVGLTMNFSIGKTPIKDMVMIERHYFRGKVIREYGF